MILIMILTKLLPFMKTKQQKHPLTSKNLLWFWGNIFVSLYKVLYTVLYKSLPLRLLILFVF